jgi:phosphoribosylaminoimidazolecarboxamide formyltransferase/IMP cyclohydrolase
MSDLKKSYKTIMDDNFPSSLTMNWGDTTLEYRKRTWKIAEDDAIIEKGLRYGENPGQEAALYELVNGNLTLGQCSFVGPQDSLVGGITEANLLQFGKHPGKTNLTDMDNALNILKYLMDQPACTILKHNNPSGAAVGATISEAFVKAYEADRIAAFGGCAAVNRPVDKATAEAMSDMYLEVVLAPSYEEGTIEILSKRKNLRIVEIGAIENLASFTTKRFVDFKSLIDGSLIVQQSPLNRIQSVADFLPAETTYRGETYKIERQPTEAEYADMLFGWRVEQGITSNSVIYVKDGVTVGIGTGEQDRVGVAEIAVQKAYTKYRDLLCFREHGIPFANLQMEVKAGTKSCDLIDALDTATAEAKGGIKGAAMISDAFFPFRDGVDVGIAQGVSAIVNPGGSLRDFESIVACNEADPQVTMVLTGQRAFKH